MKNISDNMDREPHNSYLFLKTVFDSLSMQCVVSSYFQAIFFVYCLLNKNFQKLTFLLKYTKHRHCTPKSQEIRYGINALKNIFRDYDSFYTYLQLIQVNGHIIMTDAFIFSTQRFPPILTLLVHKQIDKYAFIIAYSSSAHIVSILIITYSNVQYIGCNYFQNAQ